MANNIAESPLSINFRLYDSNGIQTQFTIRSPSNEVPEMAAAVANRDALIDSLLENGWTVDYINKGAPVVTSRAKASSFEESSGDHACSHGQRTLRTGKNKKGGTWQGYFCAARQCDVEWVNDK